MVNRRRHKSNLLKSFRYLDLSVREQADVKRAMEKYNNQGGNCPEGLKAKYDDPIKFYEQVIKQYGWSCYNV